MIINHATKTVTKTTTPDNPNYNNFAIEQAVWRELGGAQFPNDHTIVMDYFGPAGTFETSHIPLIAAVLDDLNDAVSGKAGDIGLVPSQTPTATLSLPSAAVEPSSKTPTLLPEKWL